MKPSTLLWLLIVIFAGFPRSLYSQSLDPRETFAQAYTLYAAGNFSQAQELFQKIQDPQYLLADYSLYYSALIAFKQNNWDLSRQLLAKLRQQYPQTIWFQHAELLRAKIDLAEKKYPQAIATLNSLRAIKGVKAEIAEESLYLQAQTGEAQGDVSQAYSLYQELRKSYPRSRWTADARKRQARI